MWCWPSCVQVMYPHTRFFYYHILYNTTFMNFTPSGDSTCGQRAIYHSLGLTGIPIFNVNNNCSTGSTALFMARQLIQGGELNRKTQAASYYITFKYKQTFLQHVMKFPPGIDANGNMKLQYNLLICDSKWTFLCWICIMWSFSSPPAGVADCVLALGFEKMERGSLSSKVSVSHC